MIADPTRHAPAVAVFLRPRLLPLLFVAALLQHVPAHAEDWAFALGEVGDCQGGRLVLLTPVFELADAEAVDQAC